MPVRGLKLAPMSRSSDGCRFMDLTMTWNQILIFSTLLIFAPTSLLRAEENRDCANAMTQVDMNQCAHTDFEEADKELNVIWEAARERARKLDEQHAEMKGAEAALLAAERGWIAYRDGHRRRYGRAQHQDG